jgi:aspartyl aminopeptidase
MAEQINKELLNFMEKSPTSFHATENSCSMLLAAGFKEIHECDSWNFDGGKYFIKKNSSAVIAFSYKSNKDLLDKGWRIVGAHTDSPALKVKPNPELSYKKYQQLGVEVYGGLILSTWFDRDLSLAGRVTYKNENGSLESVNIDFKRAIGFIPNVAIHLEKTLNDNRTVNKQKEMPPLIASISNNEKFDFAALLKDQLSKEGVSGVKEIMFYDLFFYDYQSPALVGIKEDYIASARLDNLVNCFLATKSIVDCNSNYPQMIVLNDHEEVGSNSSVGAAGNFLKSLLKRLGNSEEEYSRTMSNSFLVSADNAHAVHPNYVDKHEPKHMPEINGGPVIKINANQRYSSTSETAAIFSLLCEQVDVPCQVFVNRSDMGCGSTIGPISSTVLGIRTVDIGLPTFGMHSIRELAGTLDTEFTYRVFNHFFETSADSLAVTTCKK